MARPFTYISSRMYYDFEIYLFKLAMYTDTDEYTTHTVINRNKIDAEIVHISNILHVMRMFRQIPSNEQPIMGWKLNPTADFTRLFYFASPVVASTCLNINSSHIVAVCKQTRYG